MITKSIESDQTNLKWLMIGKNKFPMNLMNMIIDGMLGKDLSKSLKNVKRILEIQ